MSSRFNPLGVSGMVMPRPPSFSPPSLEMTNFERELDPYYDTLMDQERNRRSWLTPVQKVFDVLQRGQYVSANVADEIINALDKNPDTRPQILRAVIDGVTGRRKGSYEHVIRDRLGVGHRKVFEGARDDSFFGKFDWADVLGFIADVALDPTTYVGLGGIGNFSKGAVQAAEEFADDAVRIALRGLADKPADIVARTIGARNADDAAKAIEKIVSVGDTNKGVRTLGGLGDDLGRFIDLTYREARNRALRRTQQQLAGETMQAAGGAGLDDIMERVGSGLAYEGAGQRYGARIFGKEFGVGDPGAIGKFKNEAWERFSRLFKKAQPEDAGLRNAVWGVMNRGPIGEIRRALGMRNPYQKYLRSIELEKGLAESRVAATDSLKSVLEDIDGLSDDQIRETLDLLARKEALAEAGKSATSRRMGVNLEVNAAQRASSPDPQVNAAVDKLKGTFDKWYAEESRWAAALNESAADYRVWYVPEIFRDTGGVTRTRRGREYTFQASYQREVDLQKTIWGVDDATARRIVESDASGFGVNLRENLAQRALVHAKAKARFNLIESMKQFGINLKDQSDVVASSLLRGGRDIKQLGIKNVDIPALEGYVFDYDVADIVQRAVNVTGKDLNIFQRGMKRFANWWKGMVTATPGFHARNFLSNTVTQFLRHGARAFDSKTYWQAIAGVHEVVQSSSRKAFLGELASQHGKDVGWIERRIQATLNERVGNLTVRELAQEARRRGVISEDTMGFDARSVVDKIKRGMKVEQKSGIGRAAELARPSNQPLRSASRYVGNYVENIPRFQSFLIDYGDIAVKNVDNLYGDMTDLMGDQVAEMIRKAEGPRLDWAGREAKKWFIDYTDLSEFEQNTLKNIVPFYTWIRRNLGNQISGLFLYPELYSTLPKIEEFLALDDPDFDPALMPEWLKEAGAFPIARNESGAFQFFRPDFAHTDINMIPLEWEEGRMLPRLSTDELKNELINTTSPWLRRTVDWMMDSENAYSFFYQSDLAPTSDAPYVMRLFAERPQVIPVVDGLLRFFGYENGAHIDVRDGKLQIDSRMAQLMEEFLPFLRQLEFMVYLPMVPVPGMEESQREQIFERLVGVDDEYEGAEHIFQMMSYYMGIKITEKDLEEEKRRLGRDIYYQARDALSDVRGERPGAEQRSLEYRQRIDQSIRRLGG